ncbi:MAG: DNA adenine methylase [Clostridiales bacterium]|jgi:DNA adenine methylase|nr:DNA adenine methylase [Clostridiales bacterium]
MHNIGVTVNIHGNSSTRSHETKLTAKPFIKWAGGKTQLLEELEARLPKAIADKKTIESYIEPFVGGGALFFFLKREYTVKKAYLCDINREVIIGYKVIQNNPKELINQLEVLQDEYINRNKDERKDYFYMIRDKYNSQVQRFNFDEYNEDWIKRASYLIFLNKTCFNGLFRQNKNGKFNVPHGRYKKPNICDRDNIMEVNKALKNTEVFYGDFTETKDFIQENSLVYFDPPYRPINATSSFTGYSKEGFDDNDQKRLAAFFKSMNAKGAYLILSNSDPRNHNQFDDYFDKLYEGFNIERIKANRHINCYGNKRGQINELIIRNYW